MMVSRMKRAAIPAVRVHTHNTFGAQPGTMVIFMRAVQLFADEGKCERVTETLAR